MSSIGINSKLYAQKNNICPPPASSIVNSRWRILRCFESTAFLSSSVTGNISPLIDDAEARKTCRYLHKIGASQYSVGTCYQIHGQKSRLLRQVKHHDPASRAQKLSGLSGYEHVQD